MKIESILFLLMICALDAECKGISNAGTVTGHCPCVEDDLGLANCSFISA